jgi:hypothetical protein
LKLSSREAFLFHKLHILLKRPVHPYALLASGLAILILGTALSGMWHYQYELAHRAEPPAPTLAKAAIKGASTQPSDDSSSLPAQSEATSEATATSQPGAKPSSPPTSKGSNQSAAAPVQPNVVASPPASNPSMVTVSLSINGNSKGSVTLASSSNECEVLSSALSSGMLSNLDMRYNAQYKTYVVYVINGIGDSNAVWWTYTVNGKSPPYGCSGTAVRGGDVVNWQYVKG